MPLFTLGSIDRYYSVYTTHIGHNVLHTHSTSSYCTVVAKPLFSCSLNSTSSRNDRRKMEVELDTTLRSIPRNHHSTCRDHSSLGDSSSPHRHSSSNRNTLGRTSPRSPSSPYTSHCNRMIPFHMIHFDKWCLCIHIALGPAVTFGSWDLCLFRKFCFQSLHQIRFHYDLLSLLEPLPLPLHRSWGLPCFRIPLRLPFQVLEPQIQSIKYPVDQEAVEELKFVSSVLPFHLFLPAVKLFAARFLFLCPLWLGQQTTRAK